jgi:acyl-coenzyme A thioesterase 7
MLPDDANPAGNVHGGSILRLIDECSIICASRHVTQSVHVRSEHNAPLTALARIDRVNFENPMHIGDLAQVDAKVVGTGTKSMEIQVSKVKTVLGPLTLK